MAWKAYPHPAIESRSVIGDFLGLFLFAAAMFSFVLMVRAPCLSCASVACKDERASSPGRQDIQDTG